MDSNSTLGWGEDNPGAGAGGAGNYMLDVNGQAITFNGKDNAYIFVSRHIGIITYYYMVVNILTKY